MYNWFGYWWNTNSYEAEGCPFYKSLSPKPAHFWFVFHATFGNVVINWRGRMYQNLGCTIMRTSFIAAEIPDEEPKLILQCCASDVSSTTIKSWLVASCTQSTKEDWFDIYSRRWSLWENEDQDPLLHLNPGSVFHRQFPQNIYIYGSLILSFSYRVATMFSFRCHYWKSWSWAITEVWSFHEAGTRPNWDWRFPLLVLRVSLPPWELFSGITRNSWENHPYLFTFYLSLPSAMWQQCKRFSVRGTRWTDRYQVEKFTGHWEIRTGDLSKRYCLILLTTLLLSSSCVQCLCFAMIYKACLMAFILLKV